jgi:hypothetical protein
MIRVVDGNARLLFLLVYVAVFVATACLWRRSYRVSHEFYWGRRDGAVILYVSFGQFRLFRSWPVQPPPDQVLGLKWRTHSFAPMFSPTRMPADVVHIAAAGFTYASGRNPNTGTRYRVASIPIWLPGLIALIVLAGWYVG